MENVYAGAPRCGFSGVRGPNETQGSEARSYIRSAGVPAAHWLKGSGTMVHFDPPLVVTAAANPWAPPLLHRSCWKTVIKLFELVGLTAPYGSTSEST